MKKFEITIKNSLIMFGNNISTKILEGETPEKALVMYSFQKGWSGMLQMISYKEVVE